MTRPTIEPHTRGSEFGVFFIPHDLRQPMSYRMVDTDLKSLQRLVGGYIEIVRTQQMPALRCGCNCVMAVNEEGLIEQLPVNFRASMLTPPFLPVVGDVFLIGEGLCRTPEGGAEIDFISLPPEFNRWRGANHPVPEPAETSPWLEK